MLFFEFYVCFTKEYRYLNLNLKLVLLYYQKKLMAVSEEPFSQTNIRPGWLNSLTPAHTLFILQRIFKSNIFNSMFIVICSIYFVREVAGLGFRHFSHPGWIQGLDFRQFQVSKFVSNFWPLDRAGF